MAMELIEEVVPLSSDYIGNTIIQKVSFLSKRFRRRSLILIVVDLRTSHLVRSNGRPRTSRSSLGDDWVSLSHSRCELD